MSEKINEGDFIEIEFTGRTNDGKIFDSNIEEDVKKAGLNTKPEPLIISVGRGMFLKGVDEFLIGKNIKSDYEIKIHPEKAFGLRNPNLIQVFPLKSFLDHNINPIPGAMFNLDGRIGKILSNTGGRIRVDFNHPLAGKEVIYKIKVLRKTDDKKEQIRAFNKFLFNKDLDFEVENGKIIFEAEKPFSDLIGLFNDKFKEIFGLEVEVKKSK